MFVSAEDLKGLTGLVQPAAQARWLAKRGYAFERRADGSIALRQDEYDAHTLSAAKDRSQKKRPWRMDLSALDHLPSRRRKVRQQA